MKISQRELEILQILHSSEQPLTSSQIFIAANGLSQSTIQAVIRKLMAADLIEVKEIKHSSNVLSRAFGATESSKEVLNQHFLEYLRAYKSIIGLRAVIECMLKMEKDEKKKSEYIRQIEELMEELKGQ